MSHECNSPATQAGVLQHQHQYLADENARLRRLLARAADLLTPLLEPSADNPDALAPFLAECEDALR